MLVVAGVQTLAETIEDLVVLVAAVMEQELLLALMVLPILVEAAVVEVEL
jgi:hypothetical protein